MKTSVIIVSILAGLSMTGAAWAELIQNPGFEDQVLAPNEYVYDVQAYNDDYVPEHAYVVHPGDTWNLASPHSGNNIMVMVGDYVSDTMNVYQDITTTMVPGTTYSLSAYITTLSGYDPAHYFMSLVNNRTGLHVASITSDTTYIGDWPIIYGAMADSEWAQIAAPSYTATEDDAGYDLQVVLWTWKVSSSEYYDYNFVAWDDLSLSTIPEPATMMLLGIGGMLVFSKKMRNKC